MYYAFLVAVLQEAFWLFPFKPWRDRNAPIKRLMQYFHRRWKSAFCIKNLKKPLIV